MAGTQDDADLFHAVPHPNGLSFRGANATRDLCLPGSCNPFRSMGCPISGVLCEKWGFSLMAIQTGGAAKAAGITNT
jgi:hypothetical protein